MIMMVKIYRNHVLSSLNASTKTTSDNFLIFFAIYCFYYFFLLLFLFIHNNLCCFILSKYQVTFWSDNNVLAFKIANSFLYRLPARVRSVRKKGV